MSNIDASPMPVLQVLAITTISAFPGRGAGGLAGRKFVNSPVAAGKIADRGRRQGIFTKKARGMPGPGVSLVAELVTEETAEWRRMFF